MMRRILPVKMALIGVLAFNLSACNAFEDVVNEASKELEKRLIEQVHNLINYAMELLSQQLEKVQDESDEQPHLEPPTDSASPHVQPDVSPHNELMPGPDQYET